MKTCASTDIAQKIRKLFIATKWKGQRLEEITLRNNEADHK